MHQTITQINCGHSYYGASNWYCILFQLIGASIYCNYSIVYNYNRPGPLAVCPLGERDQLINQELGQARTIDSTFYFQTCIIYCRPSYFWSSIFRWKSVLSTQIGRYYLTFFLLLSVLWYQLLLSNTDGVLGHVCGRRFLHGSATSLWRPRRHSVHGSVWLRWLWFVNLMISHLDHSWVSVVGT